MSLRLPAPAKLNRFLHITGRREDGYHLLQTVFQLIDQMDWLTFEITKHNPQIQLISDLPFPPEQNLIYRAALKLQQHTQTAQGVVITLEKHLPMGGGLGGGSSNAATTLLALNHLWQTGLSLNELAQLGLSLGADVPVFVRGQNAWAEGVGEQLSPLSLPDSHFIVLTPDCMVSTAEIFGAKGLTRDSKSISLTDYQAALAQGEYSAAIHQLHLHNDCETVVRRHYPAVDQTLSFLAEQKQRIPAIVDTPMLTGTGACVFLKTPNRAIAEQIHQESPFRGFVCSGIGQSPVHSALNLL